MATEDKVAIVNAMTIPAMKKLKSMILPLRPVLTTFSKAILSVCFTEIIEDESL